MFVEWSTDTRLGRTRIWVAGMVDGEVLNVRHTVAGPMTWARLFEAVAHATSHFLGKSLHNAHGSTRRERGRLALVGGTTVH